MAPPMPIPGRRSHLRKVEFRKVTNAARFLVRPRRSWQMLPAHFGHWRKVHEWFRELPRRFLFQTTHDIEPVRERARREASPSVAVTGSQAVKAPQTGIRGCDACKQIVGHKRHIAIDTDGRLLMVKLTTADISDSAGAQTILDAIRQRWPWMKHLSAHAVYNRLTLINKAAYLDFIVEIIHRPEGVKCFAVQLSRRVLDRIFGLMKRWRRLVHDLRRSRRSLPRHSPAVLNINLA